MDRATLAKNLYLDVCALCRPYDDQSYMRIRMETIAVHLIFSAIERNAYVLAYSTVHMKEIAAISDPVERFELFELLEATAERISSDARDCRNRAEALVSFGLGPADAAHLSHAEAIGADFVTCDDKLCHKCRKLDLKIWTGNPVAFCEKEGLR